MISPIFGLRLRELREEKNLTQKELGLAVKLSGSAIGSLEHARRPVSLEKALEIAIFFNVSLDYLLGRTDKIEVNH